MFDFFSFFTNNRIVFIIYDNLKIKLIVDLNFPNCFLFYKSKNTNLTN